MTGATEWQPSGERRQVHFRFPASVPSNEGAASDSDWANGRCFGSSSASRTGRLTCAERGRICVPMPGAAADPARRYTIQSMGTTTGQYVAVGLPYDRVQPVHRADSRLGRSPSSEGSCRQRRQLVPRAALSRSTMHTYRDGKQEAPLVPARHRPDVGFPDLARHRLPRRAPASRGSESPVPAAPCEKARRHPRAAGLAPRTDAPGRPQS